MNSDHGSNDGGSANRYSLGSNGLAEAIIETLDQPLLILNADLTVAEVNAAYCEIFGVDAAATRGQLIYRLGNGQWDIPHFRELLENVLPHDNAFDDVEVAHEFEMIGHRIMLLKGRRLDHLDLVLLAIRDVTDRRRLEAQQKTLVNELNHRVKNVLTSVSALVSRTLRESRSLEEFNESFRTRLDAFFRTQDLLTRPAECDVLIREVLRLELQAQGGREGRNFDLNGPSIALSREATQAFAMAIHELTTNAVKHGAWASPEGRVEVTWKAQAGDGDKRHIRFRWREHCPKIDTNPARKGYGSRVLERVFSHSLDGTSELTLRPDGAEFVAEFKV